MFDAAATVGVATRPLLLFYGLSQGGRAVAAAAKHVGNNEYQLRGHGIKTHAGTMELALPAVAVSVDGRDDASYRRVSTILGSPTWGEASPLTVGEIWNSLPEGRAMSIDSNSELMPLQASVETSISSASEVLLFVHGLPNDVTPSFSHNGPTPEFDRFLARYPSLDGYVRRQSRGVQPFGEGGLVEFLYPTSAGAEYHERKASAEAHSTVYRLSDRYIFPALGANSAPLHPLMAWWALLFALSILARYYPAAWADHIAVDSSKVAVNIERLLSGALLAVPEILLRTIVDVSQ